MSRVKKFSKAVFSGYALLGVNILYTLASVPLALNYLTKEEFGLWALVTQVCNFNAMLIDMGMAGAMSRILIDHKDDKTNPNYGSVIQTGFLVLLIQGVLIAGVGGLISYWLPQWMAVPGSYWGVFRSLVIWQCVLLAVSFSMRIWSFILIAHQRYDISNYSSIYGLIINFTTLWLGFGFGLGLYSLLLAGGVNVIFSSAYGLLQVRSHNLLPVKGSWGSPSRKVFNEIFAFGMDVFLLSIGQQLIASSQILLITRSLGLETATKWNVATKLFVLAQQVVYRLFDYSTGAFSEMMVRNEWERLKMRFRDIMVITASASIAIGSIITLCNQPFLYIWTKNRISWSFENDLWMTVSLMVYALTRCHVCLAGIAKQIKAMKYIYFTEGVAFFGLGLLVAPIYGLTGIIITGIMTNLIFSGVYGNYRSAKYFGARNVELLLWLKSPTKLLFLSALVAGVIWWLTRSMNATHQLLVRGIAMSIISGFLFIKVGLTRSMYNELIVRITKRSPQT